MPPRDSDAYSATQSVLSAYHGARGSSASYRAAQKSYGVAVFPTQVLAPDGSMAAVTPVMEQKHELFNGHSVCGGNDSTLPGDSFTDSG